MQLSIKTDFKDIQRQLDRLPRELQTKVIPAALNKVAPKARTEMVRQITSEFNIRAGDVRSRLRLTKASRSLDKWQVRLDPYASARASRSLNLIRFLKGAASKAPIAKRRRLGTQLQFQVKKRAGRQQITGAFIANKGRTVFVRLGRGRLPVKALSTIDVPQMFNTRRLHNEVVKRILAELPVEMERAIRAAGAGVFR